MKQAVVVSTARTPIGKAYRGAWNNTEGPTMVAHAIGHALERANLTPGEVGGRRSRLRPAAGHHRQ